MEDSIFIEVLKYGAQKGIEGLTVEELYVWGSEHGYLELDGYLDPDVEDVDQQIKRFAFKNLFLECFQQSNYAHGAKSKTTYVLKNEYYFRLIEYRELQESRTAARSANKNSMWAIGISVAAIIVSAVLTFAQLNTPTTINKSDLQALINSNAPANVQREVKLDSLQMAQILSAIGYDQSNSRTKKKKAINQGQEVSHHELINQYFEDN